MPAIWRCKTHGPIESPAILTGHEQVCPICCTGEQLDRMPDIERTYDNLHREFGSQDELERWLLLPEDDAMWGTLDKRALMRHLASRVAEVERLRENERVLLNDIRALSEVATGYEVEHDEARTEIERLRERLESCERHYEAHNSDDYGAWLRVTWTTVPDKDRTVNQVSVQGQGREAQISRPTPALDKDRYGAED